MLKFITEFDGSKEKNIKIPAGNYGGLLIKNDGDITSSAATDFADAYLLKGGEPIQFLKLDELKDLDNILYGLPVLTFVTDHFSSIQLFAPFSMLSPKSTIVDIAKEDDFSFQYIPKTVSAGNLLFYGETAEQAEENYLMHINRQTIQGSGRLAEILAGENFLALYVIPGTNATRMSVEKDGNLVANAEIPVLIAEAEMFSRVESGTLSSFLIDLAPTGSVSEALNDNVRVVIDHSADDSTIVYGITASFDEARSQRSIIKKDAIEQNKIAKKLNATTSVAKRELISRVSRPIFEKVGRTNRGGAV